MKMNKIDKKELGRKLRIARRAKNLTQEQLANRVSITKKYLERIETGERTPSTDVLVLLARVLNASLDDLLSILPDRPDTAACELARLLDPCTEGERAFLTDLLTLTRDLIFRYR